MALREVKERGPKRPGSGSEVRAPAEVWAMDKVRTPIGELWLVTRNERLWGAELEPRWPQLAQRLMTRHGLSAAPGRLQNPRRPGISAARSALRAYFRGQLDAPARIELDLEGSELQRTVWSLLGQIEPGTTITYGDLAVRARQKGAFRAIGAANGANPCAIFVPCHRVVGATGALQGYGGGLDAKSWLLEHEGVANDGRRLSGNRSEGD